MKIIIRAAKIIDSKNPFHNQVVDIQINQNRFEKIGKNLPLEKDYEEFSHPGLHLSQGWFDSSVSFGEPGYEDCETIPHGLTVAAKSGFTGIALQPHTFPILDHQALIRFVQQKAQGCSTELFPIGAMTKNSEGKDLAELFDMKNAGAIAFGDYKKNCTNSNVLKIALQYVQDFDGLVMAYCEDPMVKGKGIVHEGVVATQLGLKGIPAIAEELMVARNLALVAYTGGQLHIPTVSSAGSVALIRDAKAKGIAVTCSVAVHHLVLTEETLTDFDTNFKISPPLRSEHDRMALIAGVLDDTIDLITSDHTPVSIEDKNVEFDIAKEGTIGLESTFGALLTVLPLEKTIEKLTAARTIFNIKSTPICEGNDVNITLFTPDSDWTFTAQHILSTSKNSAFINQSMKGRVIGTYHQGILTLA
ncbi:dihydroorotase [Flavobacterium aciduliphilum]|uniref:Dihydroorotase n=1 Tax=Flavobacterium aciduliphilum TaxID=1101402 RepID=A0A328Y9R4_9FLAO|nr:dihydroorotase [Flavobacterium aciduliphilum]RAR70811.1 dihydroorotase [Flavobacterium aciduliphilum]